MSRDLFTRNFSVCGFFVCGFAVSNFLAYCCVALELLAYGFVIRDFFVADDAWFVDLALISGVILFINVKTSMIRICVKPSPNLWKGS